MIRFLILFMITMTLTAEAAIRRLATAFEHSPPIFSLVLRTFSSIPAVVDSHNLNKKYGNKIRADWSKQKNVFRDSNNYYWNETHFCKAAIDPVTQQFIYTTGVDFTDADVEAALKPEIPAITTITTREDILKIAVFHKRCVNYLTAQFLRTQDLVGYRVHDYCRAIRYEPEEILNLVRPIFLNESLKSRVKKESLYIARKREKLIQLFIWDNKLVFPSSAYGCDWKPFYLSNRALVDATLKFGKLIYVHTPNGPIFETEDEFNEALIKVDPDFGKFRK